MAPAKERTQSYRDRLKADKEKYELYKEKERERSRKKREEERKKMELNIRALFEKRKKDAARQRRRRDKLKKMKLAKSLEQGIQEYICQLKEKGQEIHNCNSDMSRLGSEHIVSGNGNPRQIEQMEISIKVDNTLLSARNETLRFITSNLPAIVKLENEGTSEEGSNDTGNSGDSFEIRRNGDKQIEVKRTDMNFTDGISPAESIFSQTSNCPVEASFSTADPMVIVKTEDLSGDRCDFADT